MTRRVWALVAALAMVYGLIVPVASATVSGGLYGTDGSTLYTIDKTNGAATVVGAHGPVEIFIGALEFAADGTLYGISGGSSAQLYTINTTTGAATAVGPLGIGFVFEGGLAFDPSGTTLLGVDQGDATDAKTFSINVGTGAATIVGPAVAQARDINGLASDSSDIYGIDRVTNAFGRLNQSTGAFAAIGSSTATMGGAGGLAIDPADGTIYATFSATGGFYTIDRSTGAETLIATNSVNFGLAFAPVTLPPPAEPGKIIVKKEVTAGSDVSKVFTFTESGFTLDDNTLAHGEMGMSGDVEPGSDYSVSESVPVSWTLQQFTCDDANSTPSDINVEEGETVTCTFVNIQLEVEVDIDIKPGSFPNSINPKSMGVVPVAILGSATFDVTTVDVTTLAFGPDGAAPRHDLTDALVYADHLEDVNGDGLTDLVSHYRQKEAGLEPSDTEACLTGEAGGIPFEGCDSVRVLGG